MKLMIIKFILFTIGGIFIGAGGYAVALGMKYFGLDFSTWHGLSLFFSGLVTLLIGLWVWTK